MILWHNFYPVYQGQEAAASKVSKKVQRLREQFSEVKAYHFKKKNKKLKAAIWCMVWILKLNGAWYMFWVYVRKKYFVFCK